MQYFFSEFLIFYFFEKDHFSIYDILKFFYFVLYWNNNFDERCSMKKILIVSVLICCSIYTVHAFDFGIEFFNKKKAEETNAEKQKIKKEDLTLNVLRDIISRDGFYVVKYQKGKNYFFVHPQDEKNNVIIVRLNTKNKTIVLKSRNIKSHVKPEEEKKVSDAISDWNKKHLMPMAYYDEKMNCTWQDSFNFGYGLDTKNLFEFMNILFAKNNEFTRMIRNIRNGAKK